MVPAYLRGSKEAFMSKPVSRLGRGLSGIIGTPVAHPQMPAERGASIARDLPTGHAPHEATVRTMPIDKVIPNPRQPRTHFADAALGELAASIRVSGILQPVLVRPLPSGAFELVAGERRWRAAKLAGLSTVPALVREMSDAESLELALVENLQREDLGPLERAS